MNNKNNINAGKKCKYGACEKPAFARGFCRYHYRIEHDEGGLSTEKKLKKEQEEREAKEKKRIEVLNSLSDEELKKIFLTPCKTRQELMNFVKFFFGLHLPDVNVSRYTDINPFDALWEMYQITVLNKNPNNVKEFVYCASRGSGKTISVAIAQLLAVIHGKRDVVHVGAILSQAERCYSYVKGFMLGDHVKNILMPPGSREENRILKKDTMSKSILNFGNRDHTIEIVPCTLKSVNGPHVSFVTVDEVDTLATGEQMKAYKDISGMLDSRDGKKPLRVNISTRKSRYGLMNQLMENAEKQGRTVRRWTVFEFMERCPDSRSGIMKQSYYIDQMRFDIKTEAEFASVPDQSKKEYSLHDMYVGCRKCPIAPICLGDAKKQISKSPMLKTIDEVGQKVLSEGPDWALSQLMNLKPSVEGIVYKEFDERIHIVNWNKMWEKLTSTAFPGMCDHDIFIKKCFSSDTEVLTNNGFKLFKDLTPYDSIATLNNSGQLEYQTPSDYVSYHYKGKMINIYNEIGGNGHHMDMLVTPNHDVEYLHGRNYRKDKKVDLRKVRADEISNINDFYIPATWLKPPEDKTDIESPISFMTDDQYVSFLGLWLSEGSMTSLRCNGLYGHNEVSVSQSKSLKASQEVDELMRSINWPSKLHIKTDPRDGVDYTTNWCVFNKELYDHLSSMKLAVSKKIPRYILETASKKQLELLLHWLCFGDGAYMFDGSKQQPYYSTGSKQLADDVQELCFRLGYRSSLVNYGNQDKYGASGTMGLNRYRVQFHWKQNNKPADKNYYINNGQNKSEFNQKVQKNIAEVDYDDMVYCVTMPSSRLFVRRNGVITLSGNCHSMGLQAYSGIDWGWSNPSTLVVFFVDKKENIYVVKCDGQTYVSNPTWINHIKTKWHNKYKICLYFPDSADPGNIQEMKKAGLPASDKAGKSKINTGVQVIKKWLRAPGSSDAKIFLSEETCKPLVQEFLSYHFKTSPDGAVSDDIDTENDHYLDALRYAVEGIFGQSSVVLSSESMTYFDTSSVVTANGQYLKAPTAEEWAIINNVTPNSPDETKIGKIGRWSQLEGGDEDENTVDGDGGMMWTF